MTSQKRNLILALPALYLCLVPSLIYGEAARSLPGPAQSAISAILGRDDSRYQVSAADPALRAGNPAQALVSEFTREGIDVFMGQAHLRLVLRGYGYGGELRLVRPAAPERQGNRVEYRRGPIAEWYINGPAGLEQGFTIAKRPAGIGSEALTLALRLTSDLTASLEGIKADGLALRDSHGNTVLRYSGLTAYDASGRELPSWMELANDEIRLRVKDAGAHYPIVVDPYLQQAKLTASDAQPGAYLGFAVSMSSDGQTIVAGAPEFNSRAGAAYVFTRPGPFWMNATQVAKLTPQDPVSGHQFGIAVSISGDSQTVAVGAHAPYVGSDGSVYVYTKPAAGWVDSSSSDVKLTPPDETGDYFGNSVSLSRDGSTLAVGAPDSQSEKGAVYVFLRPSAGWPTATNNFAAKLTAPDAGMFPQLGWSVSVSQDGGTLTAGALGVDAPPYVSTGAAYVFIKPAAGPWATTSSFAAKLTASDGADNTALGTSIAISGDATTVVVGANNFFARTGAAYVFVKTGAWATTTQTAKLTVAGQTTGNFAISVAANDDGSVLLVGNDTNDHAWVFQKPGGGWATTAFPNASLSGSDVSGGNFGHSVSVSGDGLTTVAGAYNGTAGNIFRAGAAYVLQLAVPATQSTTSLSFGNQAVGTVSQAQTVTLTNNAPAGAAPLHIAFVSHPGGFSTTSNCVAASPLAVGASCTESVTFSPASVGPVSSTIQIAVDSSVRNVDVSGTGVKAGTTTSITSIGPSPSVVGQAVTVAFSVTGSGGNLLPSGVVAVSATTGESCTGAAPSGSCSLTFLAAGARTVTASYVGDANFLGSRSRGFNTYVAANVSSQVTVTQTGFGRNRATGIWSASMTLTNTSAALINGPIWVVLTNLTSGVNMVNNSGMFGAAPYIAMTAGTLAPGASVTVSIQFNNPSNGFINFAPVTYSLP